MSSQELPLPTSPAPSSLLRQGPRGPTSVSSRSSVIPPGSSTAPPPSLSPPLPPPSDLPSTHSVHSQPSPTPAAAPTAPTFTLQQPALRRTLDIPGQTARTFGYWPDLYLDTHGYTESARSLVGIAFDLATDCQAFVRALHGRDVPDSQLMYLYMLLVACSTAAV